jgi:hypothetical protein
MSKVTMVELSIKIVSSKTGGADSDSYNRSTTIKRVQQAVLEAICEHIPADDLCSLVIGVRKR